MNLFGERVRESRGNSDGVSGVTNSLLKKSEGHFEYANCDGGDVDHNNKASMEIAQIAERISKQLRNHSFFCT